MRVSNIMSPSVQLADPRMTIRDAARCMRRENIGSLPVGENDRLVGMVTDRDIVTRAVAEGRDPCATAVRDVMSEGICYVYDDDDIRDAARIMARHQIRRLPVLNARKRLVGVVSLADISLCEDRAGQVALEGISEPSEGPRALH